MAKVISEEQEKEIVERLNNQYGCEDEDWAGGKVKIKGVEKFYAVKSPSSDAWLIFKTQRDEYYAKMALNKKLNIKLEQVVNNLVIDCLIDDVPGCANLNDYRQDIQTKPGLIELLQELVNNLHNSGLDGLKKNQ